MDSTASSSAEKMSYAEAPKMDVSGSEKPNLVEAFNHFVAAAVIFNRQAPLPELRAIWESNGLDVICDGARSESGLLEYARMWCSMSEAELIEALSVRGLREKGEKWHLVEVLMRDDYESVLTDEDCRFQQMEGCEGYPDPAAMNLVVSTIHENTPTLPIAKKELQILLNRISDFKTPEDVKRILSAEGVTELASNCPSKKKVSNLLSWIWSQANALRLELATGKLTIPGIHEDVQQFIVSRPKKELLERFNAKLAAASGQSILVFHGTPLGNVRSILQNGFSKDPDCWMWTVEEPSNTINYAYKGMGHQAKWANTPYRGFGVILGCELAGLPSDIGPEGASSHMVADTNSLLVRYVFVLPPFNAEGGGHSAMPPRAEIEPAMIAAFEKLRAYKVLPNQAVLASTSQRLLASKTTTRRVYTPTPF